MPVAVPPEGVTTCVPVWWSSVFGVTVELQVPAPVLPPLPVPPAQVDCVVQTCSRSRLLDEWPGGEAVAEMRNGDGSLAMRVFRDAGGGYLLELPPFGLFAVSASGHLVRCAVADSPPWWWQRVLVGQALPLVSLLQGHEVLHASAVEVDGACVVICGAVGSGKTSLALRLAALGHPLLAEDVCALDLSGSGPPLVLPGVAALQLRAAEVDVLTPGVVRAAGGVLLGRADKTVVTTPRVEQPLPVRAVCLLEKVSGGGFSTQLVPRPGLAELAGWTFVPYVAGPEAALLHFRAVERLADVPVLAVRNDHTTGSAAAAGALLGAIRSAAA